MMKTILNKYISDTGKLMHDLDSVSNYWETLEAIRDNLKGEYIGFDEDYKISRHVYRHIYVNIHSDINMKEVI